jgi:TRAP-type C4-dicarboxylate transport system permease large subunit
VPLIIPLAQHYGVHPLHLGIIFLMNLEIGYCMPPVGLNLFLASFRFQKPIILLYRAVLPFLIIQLITLALITYIPALTLYPVKLFVTK